MLRGVSMEPSVARPAASWFDGDDPPGRRDLNTCIHCGLCLTACPTYRELKIEPDSPRGRLYLMRGLGEGRIAPSDPLLEHLDNCLGCRACETVCPAGVPYGRLLEETRGQLNRRAVRGTPLRMLGDAGSRAHAPRDRPAAPGPERSDRGVHALPGGRALAARVRTPGLRDDPPARGALRARARAARRPPAGRRAHGANHRGAGISP